MKPAPSIIVQLSGSFSTLPASTTTCNVDCTDSQHCFFMITEGALDHLPEVGD